MTDTDHQTMSGVLDDSLEALLDRETLRTQVDDCLATFLAERTGELRAVSAECDAVTAAIVAFVQGGKRLRPAFCYWGWRGAGGQPDRGAIAAASALEMFHTSGLIHDDLMDNSDVRRGIPSVHKRLEGLHDDSGWVGPGKRFGQAGALLAGDFCLAWSDQMYSYAPLPADVLERGRPLFNQMRTELIAGQYLDMLEQCLPHTAADTAVAIERARRVIHYKTAKYSVEHPLLLGGVLAGAGPDLLASYSAYGLPLGEAFQLRDDLLGVFGEPAQTGKPAGDDLREGKRTVLIAQTLERADPVQTRLIERHLGDPGLDEAGVDEVRGVIVATGALELAERRIERLADQARAALAGTELDDLPAAVFDRLVTHATVRVT
jgi:geranylgeranyl diphosphate synthase, type I